MIRLQCPKCETRLGVDDSKAGGVAVCPDCGQKFRIPGKPPASASKPNPAKTTPPPRKQAAPAKQAAAKPAPPPSRPKEPWEEEDSSPYAVQEIEELGDDALKVEYGVDKDYEKKVERKRKEEEQQEFRTFLGTVVLLVVVGVVVCLLPLIMADLIYVPLGLGNIISFIGGVWMLSLAFKEDIVTFLLVFFVPFYHIYFAIKHWHDARLALVCMYLGSFIATAGLLTGGYSKIKELIDKEHPSTSLSRPAAVAFLAGPEARKHVPAQGSSPIL
jgi:hypothetical protein